MRRRQMAATSGSPAGGRARLSGLPRVVTGWGRVLSMGVAATTVAALTITVLAGHGTSHDTKYGGIPAYLPKTATPVGVAVTASVSHPQLGIEGDTIRVVTPKGTVMATVVGPNVPEEGQFPVPSTTPCTFIITLDRITGDVRIDLGAFSVVDEQSRTHTLSLSAGTPAPPAVVPAKGEATFQLTAVLPTGGGELSWAPTGKPIASWDFDVEID